MTEKAYKFGPFFLSPDRGLLLEEEEPVRLGNRALDILIALVERAGETVSSEDLISRVWPKTMVSESNLRVQLAAVRKAIRDGENQNRYIVNVPSEGYRFCAPVSILQTDAGMKSLSNLPIPLTDLVGRDEIIERTARELQNRRFITIVGAGGIGKTSVALAVAREVSQRYEHGVCFVDLACLMDAKLVPGALSAALQLQVRSDSHFAALVNFLGEKRMLIVLDNCEHVIEEAAALVEALLKSVPDVHFLATSREPFRAEGEWLQRLPPLDAPPAGRTKITASEALAFAAVQLFVDRASAILGSFHLTDAEAPALASLCHRLDGIPLAIEFAAARIDVFGIGDLAAQLDNSLAILNRGRRTAQARHRTLRATLDWSFALLPEAEQLVFARLGIFKSSFSLEAAIAVVSDRTLDAETLLDALTSLVAKSLLVTVFGAGRVSYRLLDTTRAYALEKLESTPSAAETHRRHAEFFRDTAKLLDTQSLSNKTTRFEESRFLIDDIRSALVWAFSSSGDAALGLELTVASAFVWYQLFLVDEFRSYAESALQWIKKGSWPTPSAEAELLLLLGPALYNTLGPIPAMRSLFSRALELAEKTKNVNGQIWAMRGLWHYRFTLCEHAEALRIAEEVGRRAGNSYEAVALFHRMKAITHLYRGELQVARFYADKILEDDAYTTITRLGQFDYDHLMFARALIARILWLQGFPAQALDCARASVDEAVAIKHSISICFATAVAACPIALWSGEASMAQEYLQLLEEYSTAYCLVHWHRYAEVYKLALDRLQSSGGKQFQSSEPSRWTQRHLEESSVLGENFLSDDLFARARSEEPVWCTAEILRLGAIRNLQKRGAASIEDAGKLFEISLDIARQQGALSWELRTATSIARLLHEQGRGHEAYGALRPVLDRFTEGFETSDYREAAALLERLDVKG